MLLRALAGHPPPCLAAFRSVAQRQAKVPKVPGTRLQPHSTMTLPDATESVSGSQFVVREDPRYASLLELIHLTLPFPFAFVMHQPTFASRTRWSYACCSPFQSVKRRTNTCVLLCRLRSQGGALLRSVRPMQRIDNLCLQLADMHKNMLKDKDEVG